MNSVTQTAAMIFAFTSVCFFFYMLYCTNLLVAEALPDALVVVLGGGVVQVLHLVHPQEGHLPQELVLPKKSRQKNSRQHYL